MKCGGQARKNSVPESDRARLANVNISNIFWNLMEDKERRSSSHRPQPPARKASLTESKQ